MSDTRVDATRARLTLEELRIGRPVRATTQYDLARLMHWVRGRGRSLVPQHVVRQTFASGSLSFRYRTHPSGSAIARVWVIDVRQDPIAFAGGAPYAEFTVQAGAGPTSAAERRSGRVSDVVPYVYIETPATKTAALTDLVLTIARIAGTVAVESIGCWELPRGALTADATDLGIHLDSLFPRDEIFEGDNLGTRAIVKTLAGTPGRRVGLWSWFGPEASTASTGFVDVFELPIPLIPRKDRPSDTTLSCTWDVYARVTNGTTSGEFRLAIGSGGSSAVLSVPLGATTHAWRGTGLVTLKCEDLSSVNGMRGGSYETVQLQMRRTAGAGSVAVQGCDVWEGP